MKYLVTGATGFVGPHLIKQITAQGHECRCLVRNPAKAALLKKYPVEIVQGDITKPETLHQIADKIDCVLHMATLGHMSNFTVTEEMFERINVQGTQNIMTAALNAGVPKIVHCSTVAAMGICPEIPADETTPCRPHHPYGRSKLKAENKVKQMVAQHGLPAAIVRFSMIYGPGDPRDILKLTRIAQKGLFPKIGTRPKLTPLIHVADAVQGLLLTAAKGRPGEIYLLTNSQSEPFDRLRRIIQEALKRPKFAIYIPEWAALGAAALIERISSKIGKTPPVAKKNIESTLADRVFSITKAKSELGFEPQIDPEQGLKETVAWYQTRRWI